MTIKSFLTTLGNEARRLTRRDQLILAVLLGFAIATVVTVFRLKAQGAWTSSMVFPSSVALMFPGLVLGGWANVIYFRTQGWGFREKGGPHRFDPALAIIPAMLFGACCLASAAAFRAPGPAFTVLALLSVFHFGRTAWRIQRFLFDRAASVELTA